MQYKNREPVMAHLRFEQYRESLEGLSLAERFKLIEKINMWGGRWFCFGAGLRASGYRVNSQPPASTLRSSGRAINPGRALW